MCGVHTVNWAKGWKPRFSLVTIIVASALTLMHASTPVPISSSVDGRPVTRPGGVGWSWLCFNHPPVCCSPSLPYYSHLPPVPVLCYKHRCQVGIGMVSGCSHCDVINQTQQVRLIGYRSTVALLSLTVQITADMSISDININLTLQHTYVKWPSNN